MPGLSTGFTSQELLWCVAKLVKVQQAAKAAADARQDAESAADEHARADAAFQRALKRASRMSHL